MYHGGKFGMAKRIISYFPPHGCYVEPFGGGMGVLLQKDPVAHEVYNDIDGDVVHFFRMLRDRPDDLIRAIELTPYAREELDLSNEMEGDEIERARRFYVRSWQGRGGPTAQWKSGWRFIRNPSHHSAASSWNNTERLWAIVARLKLVQIEHDSFERVINRFDTPDTLFYCDPPYLPNTRSDKWSKDAYTYELEGEAHTLLAEILNSIEGMAVVSHYPCDEYMAFYKGWEYIEFEAKIDVGGLATEGLWLNPRASRLRLPLFRMLEGNDGR